MIVSTLYFKDLYSYIIYIIIFGYLTLLVNENIGMHLGVHKRWGYCRNALERVIILLPGGQCFEEL